MINGVLDRQKKWIRQKWDLEFFYDVPRLFPPGVPPWIVVAKPRKGICALAREFRKRRMRRAAPAGESGDRRHPLQNP
jgi:hypothetical protein